MPINMDYPKNTPSGGDYACKPPLGVMPETVFEEQRMEDLCEGILRQLRACEDPLNFHLISQWAEELNRRAQHRLSIEPVRK